MVLAADPGVEGYNPRVWAYRNSIKALNWYVACISVSRTATATPRASPAVGLG